MNLREEG